MLAAELLYFGNDKEQYFNEAANEYIKRLGAYCTFASKHLREERLSEQPSESEIATALHKEGERVREAQNPKSYRIALCVEGKELSSEEFAALLCALPLRGYSAVSFVIGSSYGLSEEIKAKSDLRLSMSRMTFPHKLFRVMLLEQLYRAFSIGAGGKYHK